MPLIGAHMSIAGHPHKALIRGKDVGCQAIQIFTRNRINWSARGLSENEIAAFHRVKKETSVIPASIHSSYLINLASPVSSARKRSLSLLFRELGWAELLKIPYLVMHPGSHMGANERSGLARVAKAIDIIHERTQGYNVKILLETTAGQGTNLGYRFEHLADIMAMTKQPERLGVCFDTCHVFAAGYDFRTKNAYRQLLKEFGSVIGLTRLRLFHINDSKKGLGSKIDRHDHPGDGHIGLRPLSFFLNDPNFADLPFLLETPKGMDAKGLNLDIVNLNRLKIIMKRKENR